MHYGAVCCRRYMTFPSSAFDQVEVGLPDRSDKTKEERFAETFNQFYEAFLQEKRIKYRKITPEESLRETANKAIIIV